KLKEQSQDNVQSTFESNDTGGDAFNSQGATSFFSSSDSSGMTDETFSSSMQMRNESATGNASGLSTVKQRHEQSAQGNIHPDDPSNSYVSGGQGIPTLTSGSSTSTFDAHIEGSTGDFGTKNGKRSQDGTTTEDEDTEQGSTTETDVTAAGTVTTS